MNAEYAGHLSSYSAEAAARDLDLLSQAFKATGHDLYFYGFSYGSFVVQRLLQIGVSDPPRGVILDGTLVCLL